MSASTPASASSVSSPTGEWAVTGLAQLFDTVLSAATQSRQLSEADRERFVESGVAAFGAGMSLGGLIDSYLGGAAEIWEHIFTDADPSRTVELSRGLRRVSEQAVSSLAEGFESAQRLSIRAEESLRRRFLDQILAADSDPVRLAQTAHQIDFPLFEQVAVAVAGSSQTFNDAGPVHRRVRTELESRAPQRTLRVTARDGRIVIIALETTPTDLARLVSLSVGTVADVAWSVGVGTSASTLSDVARSYQEALDALHIGDTFGLESPVEFGQILPQRLLSADPAIATELARIIIEPLAEKSAGKLLATLGSYISNGGNMADVARELGIGSRTVGYRLDRIAVITGYSPRDADDRFVLELAYRAAPLVLRQGSI